MERYAIPTPMLVGPGCLEQLADVCRKSGIRRPLLVTDSGLREAGLVDRALEALGPLQSDTIVFTDVHGNPREEDIETAVEVYRDKERDGIIGLGGGSPLDAAKAVRLLATHEGTVEDYDFLAGGLRKIRPDLPPLIAIPTTSGTGSEVSRGALIITRRGDVQRKTLIASPHLVPRWCLLDAGLTVGLPPGLTATTGIDALTHCLEELISPREHPVVEAIAAGGLKRIARDLPRVMESPDDLTARQAMQVSAMMGGIGFEKGLGVIHSLSHAIGALEDVHHGLLNGVLLPASLEFNREHLEATTVETLLTCLGREAGGGLDALIAFFREWLDELGIPPRLRDLGFGDGRREEILARALDDHCHLTNPRPCGPDDLAEFWELAW